jgi:hypothetical protein
MIGDAIAGVVGKVIDRAWPDPAQKAQAALELEKLRQEGGFKEIDAALEAARMQTEVNKIEAASSNVFVSGWRPATGWICAAALGWHYIGRPLCDWAILMTGSTVVIPQVEVGDLLVVLLGMLGLGGMRTAEKMKGVARN